MGGTQAQALTLAPSQTFWALGGEGARGDAGLGSRVPNIYTPK